MLKPKSVVQGSIDGIFHDSEQIRKEMLGGKPKREKGAVTECAYKGTGAEAWAESRSRDLANLGRQAQQHAYN